MSTVEENKILVQRFWTGVFNDRDLSLIDQLISPDYTFNGFPNSHAQIKAFAQGLWEQYPDVVFTVMDLLGEGDKVAIRYSVEGTYSKSGKKEKTMACNVVTVENGLGSSNWQSGGQMLPEDPAQAASGIHLSDLAS